MPAITEAAMRLSVSLDIDEAAFGRAHQALLEGVPEVVQTACREGAAEAKRVHTYQDHSGPDGLTASIDYAMTDVGSDGRAEGEIFANKPYAKYVEEGTAPHEIEARRAQALHWTDATGKSVFAKRVRHPGTKPYPFMGPAYLKAERVLEQQVNILFDRVAAIAAKE